MNVKCTWNPNLDWFQPLHVILGFYKTLTLMSVHYSQHTQQNFKFGDWLFLTTCSVGIVDFPPQVINAVAHLLNWWFILETHSSPGSVPPAHHQTLSMWKMDESFFHNPGCSKIDSPHFTSSPIDYLSKWVSDFSFRICHPAPFLQRISTFSSICLFTCFGQMQT